MEKAYQMDFDEWEFLPDTEFLDFHENGKKGKKKNNFSRHPVFEPKTLIIQSSTYPNIVTTPPRAPVQLETSPKKNNEAVVTMETETPPPVVVEKKDLNLQLLTVSDQDTVSRVFFKKTEFVDIKMGSPKSNTNRIKLQTDAGSVQFEQEKEKEMSEPDLVNKKICIKKDAIWKGSVKIMGWKLTGIEALCCVGIAAATTICIFIFGRKPTTKQIQFQIYPDDKKVQQEEVKSNEGVSEAKGSPISGAHLIFGGF